MKEKQSYKARFWATVLHLESTWARNAGVGQRRRRALDRQGPPAEDLALAWQFGGVADEPRGAGELPASQLEPPVAPTRDLGHLRLRLGLQRFLKRETNLLMFGGLLTIELDHPLGFSYGMGA